MDSSFTPIEQMLKFRASRHEDFPIYSDSPGNKEFRKF